MTTRKISKSWEREPLLQQQTASILNGLDAWKSVQQSALTAFERMGFPSRKTENWKYTNLTSLVQSDFTAHVDTATSSALPQMDRENFYRVTFVNGVWQSEENVGLPEGVLITNVASMLSKELDFALPEKYQTLFSELNMALMSDAVFIFVPKNTVLEKPIHLRYYTNQASLMQHPRHLLFAEEGAELSFIESYEGQGCYFNNVITKIELGSNAKLRYYKVQRESESAFHIANMVSTLGRDAQLSCYHFGAGGKVARDDVNFSLGCSGAEAELYGLYSPKNTQLMDYHTRVDHSVGHTHSKQVYKGLVDGKARAIFNGKVVVMPEAQKITAHQNNANLLLNKQAEIDTKPELEIYANDVQCTHGATVGQLDEKALFYLASRGIPKETARKMLVGAFSEEVLSKISDNLVSTYIRGCVTDEEYV